MLSLGIDLGGTFARAAVVDASGAIVASSKAALQERSPDGVINTIELAAKHAIESAGVTRVSACGVGVAGQLVGDRGVVAVAPNLGWRNVPFAEMLAQKLGYAVRLVNDLRAAAWGEFVAGSGKGCNDLLVVFVGSGVGSAIISGGHIVNGSSNVAGEFGHIKVMPGGRICGCGERGCLEAYAGGHNLIAQMSEAVAKGGTTLSNYGPALSPATLEHAVAEGDGVAIEIFDRAAVFLSVAVANYVTILNPARLILGGGVLTHAPKLKERVVAGIAEMTNASARSNAQVVTAALGDDAGIIGAALLAVVQPPAS